MGILGGLCRSQQAAYDELVLRSSNSAVPMFGLGKRQRWTAVLPQAEEHSRRLLPCTGFPRRRSVHCGWLCGHVSFRVSLMMSISPRASQRPIRAGCSPSGEFLRWRRPDTGIRASTHRSGDVDCNIRPVLVRRIRAKIKVPFVSNIGS